MKQKRFYPTNILPSLVILLTMLFPGIALSAGTPITYQYHANQLTLQWPGNVQASHSIKGNALIFTFNRPILIQHPEQLQQQAGSVVDNVRFGYDKLMLTLASGVTPVVTPLQGGARIAFTPGLAKEESVTTSLLKIRLLAEKGEEKEALAQLDTLEQQHPGNHDILAARADILRQTGQWKGALDTYSLLMKSEPHNEDLRAAAQAIRLDHSPFVDVGFEHRDTGDSRTEILAYAQGEMRVSSNVNVGLRLERDDAEADVAVNPATNTLISVDDSFHRGEAYLTLDGAKGDTFKASLFGGENAVGVGGRYMLRDTKGVTTFGAEYHAPNWDFLETLIAEGTRDRLILGRTHHFTPRFTVMAQSGLNQYNVEDTDEAARSFSLDGYAAYAITSEHHYADFLGKDANVDLRYTLDAEYPFDKESATSATGNYYPLPITSREVHGLVLAVGKHITPPLLVEAYGGYAIDRLGDDGAKYGADMFFDLTEKVEFRAGYEHSISTEVSSEDLDSITTGLRAKF